MLSADVVKGVRRCSEPGRLRRLFRGGSGGFVLEMMADLPDQRLVVDERDDSEFPSALTEEGVCLQTLGRDRLKRPLHFTNGGEGRVSEQLAGGGGIDAGNSQPSFACVPSETRRRHRGARSGSSTASAMSS